MWTDPPIYGGGISRSAHTISESRNQVPRSIQNLKNSKKCDQIKRIRWDDTLSEIVWAMSEIPPPKPCSHDLCMAWFFWNLKRKENSRFWAVWTAPNTGLSTFDRKFCLHSSAASRRTQRTTHQIQKKSKLRDKSLLFCAKRTQTARKTHARCTQNATLSCH